jgi:aryl-alcohol dehydrogenase-like predicted oxidoreductase
MSIDASTLVPLGRTDLRVSSIGLGCWQFSGGQGLLGRFWPALTQETVDAIVASAVRGGINWFDSAEGYGWGESERSLDLALTAATRSGAISGRPLVATKWWPFLRTARHLRETVESRREALGGRVIDLYQIHQRIAFSTLKAQMNALADVVEAGHARAVGVSNFSAAAMRRSAGLLEARGVPLASNQVGYSLLDRRIETNGVLDEARRMGITIIAYSPLAQGVLTGRFHPGPAGDAETPGTPRRRLPQFRPGRIRKTQPVVDLLRSLARAHGCTPAQVALAWVTQRQPGVVVAIPGASSPTQAEQDAGTMTLRLSAEEIERLDRVSDPSGS